MFYPTITVKEFEENVTFETCEHYFDAQSGLEWEWAERDENGLDWFELFGSRVSQDEIDTYYIHGLDLTGRGKLCLYIDPRKEYGEG